MNTVQAITGCCHSHILTIEVITITHYSLFITHYSAGSMMTSAWLPAFNISAA